VVGAYEKADGLHFSYLVEEKGHVLTEVWFLCHEMNLPEIAKAEVTLLLRKRRPAENLALRGTRGLDSNFGGK